MTHKLNGCKPKAGNATETAMKKISAQSDVHNSLTQAIDSITKELRLMQQTMKAAQKKSAW